MGISFTAISAFGSNGAVIHYAPSKETNKQITNESLYLLDSGGQYKGGVPQGSGSAGEPSLFIIYVVLGGFPFFYLLYLFRND